MPWHSTPEGESTRLCRRERESVRLAEFPEGQYGVRSEPKLFDPEVMRDSSYVLEDDCNLFSFHNCDLVRNVGRIASSPAVGGLRLWRLLWG